MNKRYTLFIICLLLVLSASGQSVKIKRFGEDDGLQQSHIHVIIQDREGCIWLSSWDGLKRYDGHRFHNYKARPGDGCPLESNRINHIEELDDGRILCSTQENQYVFDPKTEKFTPTDTKPQSTDYALPDTLKAKVLALPCYAGIDIRAKFADRQGGVWVYSSRGLERVSFQKAPIQPQRYSPNVEESVRLLFTDSQGCVWIGDKDGFLLKTTAEGRLTSYLTADGRMTTEMQPFQNYGLYCMIEDSRGELWVGTKGNGLFRLHPTREGYDISHYTERDGLPSDRIYSLAEDAHHRIWIGTYGGGLALLTQQAENAYTISSVANAPTEAKLTHAVNIIDGILVAATTQGLITAEVKADAEKMKFLLHQRDPQRATSLCNNAVMDVVPGPTKVILPTLGGGTCLVKRSQLTAERPDFECLSTETGLASDENLTAVIDRDSTLWIVSTSSLSRIDPRTRVVTNYTRSAFADGLIYEEERPVVLPDGNILIGTSRGVLRFRPQDIRKSDYVPRLHLDVPEEVELPPGQHNFRLNFAALDFEQNEPIQYAYRMENDTTWYFTREGSINFSALLPGTYRLHLRSTNGDGVWVDNERIITIHQRAFFYETPLFWIVMGLLLALIVWLVWRALAIFKRQRKELEELKDQHISNRERISLLTSQLRELLPIGEKTEKVEEKAEETEDDLKFSAKIKAYIEANLNNSDLRIEEIAREMCVSRTVLYYRVKDLFSTTPNNLVTNMRIDQAQRMLRDPEVLIVDVALKCGFSDAKYFSRTFKKLVGKTPTEYQGHIMEEGKKIADNLPKSPAEDEMENNPPHSESL